MGKVLGVLGGMGPAATIDFLAKLQAATPAQTDAEHVRVVMDLHPRVPDRMAEAEAARAELAAMAGRLRTAGAQVLAMPCNSAHIAADAIVEGGGLPFIDMIQTAVAAARATGARRIGVIATIAGTGLYRDALAAAGLEPLLLDDAAQGRFRALLTRIKAGDLGAAVRAGMAALAEDLVATGAQAVIAGCSEVPLALDQAPVPLIDATEALARACVEACR